jgi:nucleoside-diphosphate-sugar epimerase
MRNEIQTILGGGGTIGRFLANDLQQYTNHIRIVGRNARAVNAHDEVIKADLLDKQQTIDAIKGSSIAYLVAGVPYKSDLWEKQWPIIMQNVIGACVMHNVKLVFFDNVYAYDPAQLYHLTEGSPLQAGSRKGLVREQMANMILHAIKHNNLQAIIARSADFYGPDTPQSIVNVMVIENLIKGKKASWYINANKLHSFTYTPDAAKATAVLGNTASAFNQVWHLPSVTSTANEVVQIASQMLDTNANVTTMPAWLIKVLGWFIPVVGESYELLYQFKNDYVFDSGKFSKHFGWGATPLQKGIKQTILSIQSQPDKY